MEELKNLPRAMASKVLLVLNLILFCTVSHAGSGDVTSSGIDINKKKLLNIETVALVSVHGEYRVKGRNITALQNKFPALEEFINGKVQFLRSQMIQGKLFPFDLLDEKTVLNTPEYQLVIQDGIKNLSTHSTSGGLLNIIGEAVAATKAVKQGQTAVDFSRQGFFAPKGYGVYKVSQGVQTVTWGDAADEKKRIMQALGGQGIQSAEITVSAMGMGGNVFGKEKGKVNVSIKIGVELPNGRKPYLAHVLAESDKETMFRSSNAGIFGGKRDLVTSTAVELGEEAWKIAWAELLEQMDKSHKKFKKYKDKKLK